MTFDDIFPTFEDLENYLNDMGWSVMTTSSNLDYLKFCYNIISYHFRNIPVRYTEEEAFKQEFTLVLYDRFSQYQQSVKIIEEIYKLDLNELLKKGDILTNYSNFDSGNVDNPVEPLNFITSQNFNLEKGSKLEMFINALNKMPSHNIFRFLKETDKDNLSFSELFTNYFDDDIYVY